MEPSDRYADLVEPNVYQEPRSAVAPFFVMREDRSDDSFIDYFDGPHNSRAEAEETARAYATGDPDNVFYVTGCVSISSCPPPVKASTRALV